jgi:hypothetical protein
MRTLFHGRCNAADPGCRYCIAHVSHNAVAADQLPVLIQSVYGSLAGLGQAPEAVEENVSLPLFRSLGGCAMHRRLDAARG